jgi:hypothetical protein
MTEQQRAAIKKLIEKQTRLQTASKATAPAFLVRGGIYTKDGRLSVHFGGGDNASDKPASKGRQHK